MALNCYICDRVLFMLLCLKFLFSCTYVYPISSLFYLTFFCCLSAVSITTPVFTTLSYVKSFSYKKNFSEYSGFYDHKLVCPLTLLRSVINCLLYNKTCFDSTSIYLILFSHLKRADACCGLRAKLYLQLDLFIQCLSADLSGIKSSFNSKYSLPSFKQSRPGTFLFQSISFATKY